MNNLFPSFCKRQKIMTNPRPSNQALSNDAEITLGLLNAVHDNEAITQRRAAKDLGVALGLINAYLKRCVKKGYVKVRQIPRNRVAYYLTPTGFAEKSRLSAEFLFQSFSLFRQARNEYAELFGQCARNGWTRIVLFGAGDLAEIAALCAHEHPIELVGVVDSKAETELSNGLNVLSDLPDPKAIDALVITDLRGPQEAFDEASRIFPKDRVLVPNLLGVTPQEGVLKKGRAR
jgi:DNA-binding MarR family transcriptional regulator